MTRKIAVTGRLPRQYHLTSSLKVYKELERLLKKADINMSVDKVLALAQTIVTIQLTMPQNKQTISRTMLMKRHQRIAPLLEESFWVTP